MSLKSKKKINKYYFTMARSKQTAKRTMPRRGPLTRVRSRTPSPSSSSSSWGYSSVSSESYNMHPFDPVLRELNAAAFTVPVGFLIGVPEYHLPRGPPSGKD
jgi:hypothetical protein